MRSKELISLEERYLAPNYKPLDVVISRGEGVWVWDADGNKYMDFLAAYSALNQGYVHPKILNAMIEQAQRCTLTSRAFRNDKLPLFGEKLCNLLGYDMMLPMNTGAEAVETAIKAARKWGYVKRDVPDDKAEIITCEGNFHGRTVTIVSFSTENDYRSGYGPWTPGFKVVEYGSVEALERAINRNTVAFLVEPIQGEAGVKIPPDGYLREVREICDRHNILFIADEIQSGLGRTGKMLACEWEGVKADLVCLGKALSGGFMPISAVVGKREALTVFGPGQHGSTFGGNPLACAVGMAAIDVLVEEGLCERAAELGEYLLGLVREIKSPYIKEVRGKGLWVGIELKPEAGGARKYCEALMEKGLLCKETHTHTIRLAPPLIITADEILWAVEQLKDVLC
ncbi:MAG: ornithine--oxo-acid transaminase [Myxococcota bacterium]